MEYRFDALKRLKTPKEYAHVFEQCREHGVRLSTRDFVILSLPNDKEVARIGFAISKKLVAKASARNQLRRILREGFRLQAHTFRCVDLVFLAKQKIKGPIMEPMINNIRYDLEKIWTKLRAN